MMWRKKRCCGICINGWFILTHREYRNMQFTEWASRLHKYPNWGRKCIYTSVIGMLICALIVWPFLPLSFAFGIYTTVVITFFTILALSSNFMSLQFYTNIPFNSPGTYNMYMCTTDKGRVCRRVFVIVGHTHVSFTAGQVVERGARQTFMSPHREEPRTMREGSLAVAGGGERRQWSQCAVNCFQDSQ